MDMSDLSKKLKELFEDQAEPKSPVTIPFPPPPPRREHGVELNELALPLRPGTEICWDFENYGLCRRGCACPFDHPMEKRSKNLPDFSKCGTKEVRSDEDDVYRPYNFKQG